MVVIAVIGILMSLILSAVVGSRETARSLTCQGNLRNIYQAYTALSTAEGERSSYQLAYRWTSALRPHLQGQGSIYLCPSDLETGGGASLPPGGAGSLVMLDSPPPTLVGGQNEHPKLQIFKERSAFVLPQDVTCDTDQPQRIYEGVGPEVSIPAGTVVDVYMGHFDAPGSGGTATNSTLTFSSEILGVIVSNKTLDASDAIIGLPGVDYPTGNPSRRLEGGNDQVFLSDDKKMIDFEWVLVGGGWIDEIRILTVPGADASYGMNNQATSKQALRPRQVLLAGYGKSIVDLDSFGAENDDGTWIEHRHFGRFNVLYGDGRIKSHGERDFFDPDKPHWSSSKNVHLPK